MEDNNQSLVNFDGAHIRRHWDREAEKWYFSVVDIVAAITDSTIPKRYWADLKIKLNEEGFEPYDKIVQLKMVAEDGKMRETDAADVELIFRIIQSIPSPKAEPIKLWLAQVGYERLEETNDPEKAIDRAVATYSRKGYSPEWINQRLKAIEVRKELTQEWSERGVKEPKEFATLTDVLTHAWSGMKTRDYKDHKNLTNQNLRDHMSTLEIVLNMLAEATTTEVARSRDAQGFTENRDAAHTGGSIAGNARKEIEDTTGRPVISPKNNLKKLLDDGNS